MKYYDVDAARKEALPRIKIHGTVYIGADMPMPERQKLEEQYLALTKRLTLREETDGEIPLTDAEYEQFRILGVQLCVVDVPDDVALALTELEFDALREAYLHSRNVVVGIVEKNDDSPEKKTDSGQQSETQS